MSNAFLLPCWSMISSFAIRFDLRNSSVILQRTHANAYNFRLLVVCGRDKNSERFQDKFWGAFFSRKSVVLIYIFVLLPLVVGMHRTHGLLVQILSVEIRCPVHSQ